MTKAVTGKKLFIFFILLLSSLLYSAECVKKEYGITAPVQNEFEHYEAEGKLFSVDIPKGWNKTESGFPYKFKDDNVTGVKLTGPLSADGAELEVSVLYYEYGSSFQDYRHYVALRENSATRLDVDKKIVYSKVIVGNKKAISFEIKTFDLIFSHSFQMPPMNNGVEYEFVPPNKKVEIIEKFTIIPAKQGFFVIHYNIPKELYDECSKTFKKITGSLEFNSQKPWSKK